MRAGIEDTAVLKWPRTVYAAMMTLSRISPSRQPARPTRPVSVNDDGRSTLLDGWAAEPIELAFSVTMVWAAWLHCRSNAFNGGENCFDNISLFVIVDSIDNPD